jgi:hypothetical protein
MFSAVWGPFDERERVSGVRGQTPPKFFSGDHGSQRQRPWLLLASSLRLIYNLKNYRD